MNKKVYELKFPKMTIKMGLEIQSTSASISLISLKVDLALTVSENKNAYQKQSNQDPQN